MGIALHPLGRLVGWRLWSAHLGSGMADRIGCHMGWDRTVGSGRHCGRTLSQGISPAAIGLRTGRCSDLTRCSPDNLVGWAACYETSGSCMLFPVRSRLVLW